MSTERVWVTKIQNSADVSICSSVCLYTHTHTLQLIYPFICRQTLRSFPYLAVVNNDAMNEGMQTSLQDSDSMSLHMYPKVELLDNMVRFSSVQSLSHVRLYNLMDCSTPGFPVHDQLPELTQSHVHQVGDAIQPSHPLLSPSPPALNLSQHQGLFQRFSSSHKMARVLEFQLQHQSFWHIFRTDLI